MGEPFTLSESTLESLVNEYQRLYILGKGTTKIYLLRMLSFYLRASLHRENTHPTDTTTVYQIDPSAQESEKS